MASKYKIIIKRKRREWDKGRKRGWRDITKKKENLKVEEISVVTDIHSKLATLVTPKLHPPEELQNSTLYF